MTVLRSLADLDDEALREVYVPPRTPWLRLNFVATLDGAAQGPDDLSKSIANDADQRVFGCLRELADVLVVGAGTVRDEGYKPNPLPFVVVSRSGQVPPSLMDGDLSRVMMATCEQAPHLPDTRRILGDDHVFVLGEHGPDLRLLRRTLEERGHGNLLCEGGPHLARDLLRAEVVDELCLTTVPRLIADPTRLRILAGPGIDVRLRLETLLEHDSTLIARWLVDR